jgi:hypothetical protein
MIEQNFSRIESDILNLMKMPTDSGTPILDLLHLTGGIFEQI